MANEIREGIGQIVTDIFGDYPIKEGKDEQ